MFKTKPKEITIFFKFPRQPLQPQQCQSYRHNLKRTCEILPQIKEIKTNQREAKYSKQ